MADPSNTSFIPKRAPKKRSRKSASRQVYVFTLISYTLIFAALIASVLVFFYHRYLENQLAQAVADLNAAIASFEVAEMERVLELDARLDQASERVEHSASGVALLGALEEATVESVQINGAKIERIGDTGYELSADFIADSFDSSLFQRGVLERTDTIESVTVNELTIARTNADDEDEEVTSAALTAGSEYSVSLSSVLEFAIDAVPYSPGAPDPQQTTAPAETTGTTTALRQPGELEAQASEPGV